MHNFFYFIKKHIGFLIITPIVINVIFSFVIIFGNLSIFYEVSHYNTPNLFLFTKIPEQQILKATAVGFFTYCSTLCICLYYAFLFYSIFVYGLFFDKNRLLNRKRVHAFLLSKKVSDFIKSDNFVNPQNTKHLMLATKPNFSIDFISLMATIFGILSLLFANHLDSYDNFSLLKHAISTPIAISFILFFPLIFLPTIERMSNWLIK